MGLFKLKNRAEEISERSGANQTVGDLKGAKLAVPDEGNGLVNVVRDYPWTLAPKTARKDVPYMTLVERRITNNVLLQQTLYNISAIWEEGGNVPTAFIDAIKDALDLEEGDIQTTEITETTGEGDSKKEVKKSKGSVKNENPTSPYAGLYDLDDTGWQFILPYFDKSNHSMRNSWGDAKQDGMVGKAIETGTNVLAGGMQDFNTIMSALGTAGAGEAMQRVGTYIERAKQYKFEGNGPTYSVQFELYNTVSVEDIINNWQLCFLLIYNNLPNRRTKTTFDPPPLYEIEIPGVRKSPATFINSLRVEFLGNTRIMDLDLTGVLGENNTGSSKFRTIVPDAYSITINFEDVLPESKNFMNAMVDPDVNVSVEFDRGEGIEYDLDESFDETKKNNITYISLSNSRKSAKLSKSTDDNLFNQAISKAGKTVDRTTSAISKAVKGVF